MHFWVSIFAHFSLQNHNILWSNFLIYIFNPIIHHYYTLNVNRSFYPPFGSWRISPSALSLSKCILIALFNFQGITACQPVKIYCMTVCFDR